ncbi:unnamed protein product [Cyprideis torosa]|uniref:Uncharacterized protein n=1 Tax=Cyprideis torosa TaxID=163714 RepID=A0A7R8WCN4_9CRUS|nr:unnamed protein product [Cyprideis torosa]CAG0893677.1 unnamed protein product [Cyprideis torosa]
MDSQPGLCELRINSLTACLWGDVVYQTKSIPVVQRAVVSYTVRMPTVIEMRKILDSVNATTGKLQKNFNMSRAQGRWTAASVFCTRARNIMTNSKAADYGGWDERMMRAGYASLPPSRFLAPASPLPLPPRPARPTGTCLCLVKPVIFQAPRHEAVRLPAFEFLIR